MSSRNIWITPIRLISSKLLIFVALIVLIGKLPYLVFSVSKLVSEWLEPMWPETFWSSASAIEDLGPIGRQHFRPAGLESQLEGLQFGIMGEIFNSRASILVRENEILEFRATFSSVSVRYWSVKMRKGSLPIGVFVKMRNFAPKIRPFSWKWSPVPENGWRVRPRQRKFRILSDIYVLANGSPEFWAIFSSSPMEV